MSSIWYKKFVKRELPNVLGPRFRLSKIQRGFVRVYWHGKYVMEFSTFMPKNSYQRLDNELIEGFQDLLDRLHKRHWLFLNQKEAMESSERISKNFSVK